MRISTFLTLSALAVCIRVTQASAQSVGVRVGVQLGTERVVANYNTTQRGG
jgi:hypothetical protein